MTTIDRLLLGLLTFAALAAACGGREVSNGRAPLLASSGQAGDAPTDVAGGSGIGGAPAEPEPLPTYPQMCDHPGTGVSVEIEPNPPGCSADPCGTECDPCEGEPGECVKVFDHYRCSLVADRDDQLGSVCVPTAN